MSARIEVEVFHIAEELRNFQNVDTREAWKYTRRNNEENWGKDHKHDREPIQEIVRADMKELWK